jgi:hypothetical protein
VTNGDNPWGLAAVDGGEIGDEPIDLLVLGAEWTAVLGGRRLIRAKETVTQVGLGRDDDVVDWSVVLTPLYVSTVLQ